jgi:anti-sigma regulatory factor (Ser/Thr protein kinase)
VNINASCELAPEPASPKLARQFVHETLHGEISEPMLHDALLVASELVTNAVVHGGTPARLDVNADDHAVTISVTDQAGTMPEVRDPGPQATSGRGLRIVEALSVSWGVAPHPDDGKAVWAQLVDHGPRTATG